MTSKVFIKSNDMDSIMYMLSWCEERFGKEWNSWHHEWDDDSDFNSNSVFYFNSEKDAILFTLRFLG